MIPEPTPLVTSASAPAAAEQPLNPADGPLIAEFIAEANSHIEIAEASLLKLEQQADDPELINAVFRSFHTIKGVAGFFNLQQIGAVAHGAESLLDLVRKNTLSLHGSALDQVLEALDATKGLIASLQDAVTSGQPLERRAGVEDLLHRLQATVRNVTDGTQATPTPTTEPASASKPASIAGGQDSTVRIATDRLDALINTVGELVITQAMVAQDMGAIAIASDQRLARNMSQLGKITRTLQDLSMSMRMVPIHGLFQRMARLVRDLAHVAGKEIEFVVEGSETELDRNVVEAMSDPLVHMIRNAVDHGIETPEERLSAGKPRAGRVTLRAYHQASSVVVEISDDGHGLNKSKILKKAAAAGLAANEREFTEQDIFRLIFYPGLSTAENVSDVSGRGVGMDVVKRNVESLRGRIDIQSAEGKGSCFTIRLPLTLAVIDGLIVRVGAERYIIPITSVERSIRPLAEQLSMIQGRGELCHIRGRLYPLLRLHRLFAIAGAMEDPCKALVVIVQTNQRVCCLLVDGLLGQQQVVIKSLSEGLAPIAGISGGAILGDGNVSLILDVPGLIELADAAPWQANRKAG